MRKLKALRFDLGQVIQDPNLSEKEYEQLDAEIQSTDQQINDLERQFPIP